jgi:hypothetical protein
MTEGNTRAKLAVKQLFGALAILMEERVLGGENAEAHIEGTSLSESGHIRYLVDMGPGNRAKIVCGRVEGDQFIPLYDLGEFTNELTIN